VRPLYADLVEEKIAWLPAGGHAGLWFNKYGHHWNQQGLSTVARDIHQPTLELLGKAEAVAELTGRFLGDTDAINEVAERHLCLIGASSGSFLYVRSTSRFLTGAGQPHPTEVGFTWHPTLGTPFLPGSGVKGAARAWAERWSGVGSDVIERVFGPRAGGVLSVGSVIFFDALPTKPVKVVRDILNPHYRTWYQGDSGSAPSDDQKPNPVYFLCVEKEAHYLFGVAPRRRGDEQDEADALMSIRWLQDLLDFVGVGAKTSAGYGRFVVDHVMQKPRQDEVQAEREAAAKRARVARAVATLSPLAAEFHAAVELSDWQVAKGTTTYDRAQQSFLHPEDGVLSWLMRLAVEPDPDTVKKAAVLCRKFLRDGIFDIDPENPPTNKKGKSDYKENQLKILRACRRVMALANVTDADIA
jgi:CRISPR-associated protein Cmr6